MSILGLSSIVDNPDGWGPSLTTDPVLFRDIPYAPFSKSDKLGRLADWNQATTAAQTKWSRNRDREFQTGIATAFNTYAQTNEDDSFQMVDNRPIQRPKYQNRRWNRGGNFGGRGGRGGGGSWGGRGGGPGGRGGWQYNSRGGQRGGPAQRGQRGGAPRGQGRGRGQSGPNRAWWNRAMISRESSVDVGAKWAVIDELDFTQLNKITFPGSKLPEGVDVVKCGHLDYYDPTFDRISTKTEKRLERFENRTYFKVTTTDDPVISRLAQENAGNVFGTDVILSALMAATRSVYSWDIIIQRVGDKLFFDKRDNSEMDLLTVNETANEPPSDELPREHLDSPNKLAQEATLINQNYSQQVLKSERRKTFDQPNPFVTEETDVESCAYRYRRFDLSEDIKLIVRCTVDGLYVKEGEELYLSIKALNEYDPKASNMDWRQKLDTQRGAVLAMELKNNSSKLGRWTAQAMLAGVDMIKLGYVSRAIPQDNARHVILGSHTAKPADMASQINLQPNNMWGVLKAFIERCMELEEGKYVLLKDPNKGLARLYSVPDDAFDAPQTEEDGEEGAGAGAAADD